MDQSPIIIKSVASLLVEGEGGLPIWLETWTTTRFGKVEARTTFKSLSKLFCYCFSLVSSWIEMLALVFFISSTTLYSMLSEITIVFYVGGTSEAVGLVCVALDVDF